MSTVNFFYLLELPDTPRNQSSKAFRELLRLSVLRRLIERRTCKLPIQLRGKVLKWVIPLTTNEHSTDHDALTDSHGCIYVNPALLTKDIQEELIVLGMNLIVLPESLLTSFNSSSQHVQHHFRRMSSEDVCHFLRGISLTNCNPIGNSNILPIMEFILTKPGSKILDTLRGTTHIKNKNQLCYVLSCFYTCLLGSL